MRLSDRTTQILKNFASINPGIVFTPGNEIRTKSPNGTVFAYAQVEETFDKTFAIYDLSKFLAVLSLHDKPDLEFTETSVILKAGKAKTSIRFADPELIQNPSEKRLKLAWAFDFDLSAADLKWLDKIGSILKVPNLVIRNVAGKIVVMPLDKKGEVVDESSYDVGDAPDDTPFNLIIPVENLMLLDNDYKVSVHSRACKFAGKDIEYLIGLDKDSTYG